MYFNYLGTHEIGHTFNLNNCTTACTPSSIMGGHTNGAADANGPGVCDIQNINSSIVHHPLHHHLRHLPHRRKLRRNARVGAGSGIHSPVRVHQAGSRALAPTIAPNSQVSLATQAKVVVVVWGQLISAFIHPVVVSQASPVQQVVVAVRISIRLC